MPLIPLKYLEDNPRNANVCPEGTLEKIRRNIERSGFYPPLIVRPIPGSKERYIILDGHHRKRVLEKLGYQEAECQIWAVDEQGAQLALATLNRLHGEDEPRKRAELLQSLVQALPLADLTQLIPESEKEIDDLLTLLTLDWEEAEARIKKQIESDQADLPIPFVCMIAPVDYPDVEKALSGFEGADQGQKLVTLCRYALNQGTCDAQE
jgi:ParB-like chromosome segregation protein Spo0J